MFNYISGLVAEIAPNLAVIDCGGVGYEINTSAYSASQLKAGEKAKLYVYTYIREDCMDLYGFFSRSEKRCFEMLIGSYVWSLVYHNKRSGAKGFLVASDFDKEKIVHFISFKEWRRLINLTIEHEIF